MLLPLAYCNPASTAGHNFAVKRRGRLANSWRWASRNRQQGCSFRNLARPLESDRRAYFALAGLGPAIHAFDRPRQRRGCAGPRATAPPRPTRRPHAPEKPAWVRSSPILITSLMDGSLRWCCWQPNLGQWQAPLRSSSQTPLTPNSPCNSGAEGPRIGRIVLVPPHIGFGVCRRDQPLLHANGGLRCANPPYAISRQPPVIRNRP